MKHPENVPAHPVPVIARPAMKASLFGARATVDQQFAREIVRDNHIPHRRLPISNTRMLKRNTGLTGKYLYAFPHTDCVAAKGKNIAEPYQPTSARL